MHQTDPILSINHGGNRTQEVAGNDVNTNVTTAATISRVPFNCTVFFYYSKLQLLYPTHEL
jgi:hypothetical protein